MLDVRISLAAGAWTAEVSPAIGGAILSLEHAGVPVLRQTPDQAVQRGDVRHTACYPMIPYANRIANGRFAFAGVDHQLAANFPGETNTLHGVAWRRAWRTLGTQPHACEIVLSHRPVGSDADDWPFAFDARQSFELSGEGLSLRIAVTNAGPTPAPAGLGLHAYFPRRPGERLAFRSAGAWSNGPDMLPDARHAGGDWDFAAGRAVEAPVLDNDFVGWDGLARLSAPGRPATVLRASPAFRALRVYTPAGHDDYAVEPVTHRADAIHHPDDPDAMTVLAPGETLEGVVRIGRDVGG